MAISTYTALLADSNQVKNETTLNANTADRVGSLFVNIVDTVFTTQDSLIEITLNHAQLLDLYNTPITLIAGQSGTLISLERVYYVYTYDTSLLNIAGTIDIKYENTNILATAVTTVDTLSYNAVTSIGPSTISAAHSSTIFGDSIIITSSDPTPTGGSTNTALKLIIHYKIISI